ncbi:MAG: hypothetical protein WD872_16160 [Pirellulaceae bacterium]
MKRIHRHAISQLNIKTPVGRKSTKRRNRSVLSVERLENRELLATFTVKNVLDSGPDSLRQAIIDANSSAGADEIAFNVAPGGSQTVAPSSPLPIITETVTIDGTTQPGYAGAPLIRLDGIGAGFANGLFFVNHNDSIVRGLMITRFAANGIEVSNASNFRFEGNYIGTDGTADLGNRVNGIRFVITGGSHTVGGMTDAARNLISGNDSNGLLIEGMDSNLVVGNYIGTNAAGTGAIANGGNGVFILGGATNNTIGGTTVEARNVISGNGSDGIEIRGSKTDNNFVLGNYIGTNAAGTAALRNGAAGVWIVGGAQNNRIGGLTSIPGTGAGNVISGNSFNNGVPIEGAGTNNNLVQGNLIGLNAAGTAAVPNGGNGVFILGGASGNTIGGTVPAARNIVSGNNRMGIDIAGSGTAGNRVLGNYVGTNAAGTAAIANGVNGIQARAGAVATQIGVAESELVVSDWGHNQVKQYLPDANVADQSTSVGLGPLGIAIVPDGHRFIISQNGTLWRFNQFGVLVNTIATGLGDTRNLAVGPDGHIYVAVHNTNRILRFNGTTFAPMGAFISSGLNGPVGLNFGPDGHLYVTETNFSNAGRLLKFNGVTGAPLGQFGSLNLRWASSPVWDAAGNIYLTERVGNTLLKLDGTTGALLQTLASSGILNGPEYLALGPDGNLYVAAIFHNSVQKYDPNTGAFLGYAIAPSAGLNLPHGIAFTPSAVAGNLISGNARTGIVVTDATTHHTIIAGNYIGTNAAGTARIQNFNGVLVSNGADDNRIGTDGNGFADDLERNVISGNRQGVLVIGSTADRTVIAGNFIGTNADGTGAIGNFTGIVVRFGAQDTRIGTDGSNDPYNVNERNIISGNLAIGVEVLTPEWNGTLPPGGVQTQGTIIAGNYIGTDHTGTAALSNGRPGNFGRNIDLLAGARSTRIGTDGDGQADDVERNIISASPFVGVWIRGSGTNDNVVAGNYIGTDKTGEKALKNGSDGVLISGGASGNEIGGNEPGSRNVISGNNGRGVLITGAGSNGNVVAGNYIGTDKTGNASLPNRSHGVYITAGANGNTVGGLTDDPGTGAGNVVSGNGESGIGVNTASNNVVQGNIIGLNASGNSPLGNFFQGVFFLFGGTGNVLGGTQAGARNIISGNICTVSIDGSGIVGGSVSIGAGATDSIIQGNYIGTDKDGTRALGNLGPGIAILGSSNNTIGGTVSGAGNVIAGNAEAGISLFNIVNFFGRSGESTGNTIAGNYIGLDRTGHGPLGNVGSGVTIHLGASNNRVERNVVSASRQGSGVYIHGGGTTGNVIAGNYIGTDADGSAAPGFGNGGWGVIVAWGASGNWIGTDGDGQNDATEGNVTSGNVMNGILINASSGNIVAGNYVGTDKDGSSPLANGFFGIFLYNASGNTIGTDGEGDDVANEAERNVVSGNAQGGIGIMDSNTNVVAGNYIGVGADGATPLGNGDGFEGVSIVGKSSSNWIGARSAATADAERNVISGNSLAGISLGRTDPIVLPLTGHTPVGNSVTGNYIGTDATGTLLVPNGQGVLIQEGAANNTIGGDSPGAGNLIRSNLGNGVTILDATSTGNAILTNSIFDNGGLGIDLGGDGVTANDAVDMDAGPNNRQNFPELEVISLSGAMATVAGVVHGPPDRTFRVEFFASSAADPAGDTEGQTYLGSRDVIADVPFLEDFVLPNGQRFITATATDIATGDTSEFSAATHNIQLTPPGPVTVLQGIPHPIPLGSFIDVSVDAGPWTVTVDWGDGTTETSFETLVQGPLGIATHAYAMAGIFTVTVAVANAHGDVNQAFFAVTARPDGDGDGIEDAIDLQPSVFSDDFSDGTTTGVILERGGQVITILDAPFPAGVAIRALPQGSQGAAVLKIEGLPGAMVLQVNNDQGGESDEIIVTHGSLILDVVSGAVEASFSDDADRIVAMASLPAGAQLTFKPESVTFVTPPASAAAIDIEFLGASGQSATAELDAGMEIAFNPDIFSFIATSTNPEPVEIVLASGTVLNLAPGQTANAGVHVDIRPDSINLDSNGTATVVIFGAFYLDVTQVNVGSVLLAGAVAWQATFVDADNDGYLDLQLKFRLHDMALEQIYADLLWADLDADGTLDETRQGGELVLTGRMLDDTLFSGSDNITLFAAGKRLLDLLKGERRE